MTRLITAKHKQWGKQLSNSGGLDAERRLFVLYSAVGHVK